MCTPVGETTGRNAGRNTDERDRGVDRDATASPSPSPTGSPSPGTSRGRDADRDGDRPATATPTRRRQAARRQLPLRLQFATATSTPTPDGPHRHRRRSRRRHRRQYSRRISRSANARHSARGSTTADHRPIASSATRPIDAPVLELVDRHDQVFPQALLANGWKEKSAQPRGEAFKRWRQTRRCDCNARFGGLRTPSVHLRVTLRGRCKPLGDQRVNAPLSRHQAVLPVSM